LFNKLFKQKMTEILEILQQPGAVVIDVRSEEEFAQGHLADSINIPLARLTDNLPQLHAMQNIIVCCASGVRSQKASLFLKQNGINCFNGGSWLDIDILKN
jgi:phage shock protein E